MTINLSTILGWVCLLSLIGSAYFFIVPDGRKGMGFTNLLLWTIRIPLTLLLGVFFIVMICTIATGAGFIAGVIGFALYAQLIYEPFCRFHDRRRERARTPILDRGLDEYYTKNLNPPGRDPYYSDPGNLTHGHSEGRTPLYRH